VFMTSADEPRMRGNASGCRESEQPSEYERPISSGTPPLFSSLQPQHQDAGTRRLCFRSVLRWNNCIVMDSGTPIGPTPTRLRQIALVAKDLDKARHLLVRQYEEREAIGWVLRCE